MKNAQQCDACKRSAAIFTGKQDEYLALNQPVNAHYPRTALWLNVLWGITAPGLSTVLAWPFRHTLGSASILMIYHLGVFLVAANHSRGAAIFASLLSVPAFAYFFAPPIFSFAITDIDNIIGLSVMLVVANLTSNLLNKTRLQAYLASQRENQATALYQLNSDLSESLNEQALATTVVNHLYSDFKVSSVILLPDIAGKLSFPVDPPLPYSLLAIDLISAQRVFREAIPIEQSIHSAIATENPILYLPLQGAQSVLGVIAMQSISAELSTFLQSYLHQIALTLERLHFATQAREAIVQAEAEASRNALLSAISHDLRTPLTRIVGAACNLMDDDKLSPLERTEFNKVIQNEAQCMSDLMSKILDMARLSDGAIMLHREWHALEEIVGGALSRIEKKLGNRPINIKLASELPLVWVDGVLIQQLLINLLENAAKYTPANTAIDIQAKASLTSLTLHIVDYGPGIPIGAEEKIFQKFYRSQPESSKDGIGLGLALCRSIVEAHAGKITGQNRSSGGAMFSVSLPLHQPPLVASEELDNQE